jgi:hypothetical protein
MVSLDCAHDTGNGSLSAGTKNGSEDGRVRSRDGLAWSIFEENGKRERSWRGNKGNLIAGDSGIMGVTGLRWESDGHH